MVPRQKSLRGVAAIRKGNVDVIILSPARAEFDLIPFDSTEKPDMSSGIGDKAFTQQWLQALTLVAREPVAQQIKPLLDTISDISRAGGEADRLAAAKRLWTFAESEGLLPLLEIVPVQQPTWIFDRDDPFQFHRTVRDKVTSFESWLPLIGLTEGEVTLSADVSSRDWLTLARQEAVRLQKSMSTGAIPAGLNLQLACKGSWEIGQGWSIRFDQAEWVVVRYEDPVSVQRPDMSEIDEALAWAIANANDQLVPKVLSKFTEDARPLHWLGCVPRLESLHQRILVGEVKHTHAWFRRVWSCVWPVSYREQNVLKGQANVEVIRQELAACFKEAPRLTTWMFVFARLVCESQLGRGLGVSADYLA